MRPRSIVILDFGGQYAHLIGSRIRRLGAFSQILPPDTPAEMVEDAAGIILSGGPQSVYETGSPQADPAILRLGIPVLGLCYGHQWIAHTLHGTVRPGMVKEYGPTDIEITRHSALFKGLPLLQRVWMSHGDEVQLLPPNFVQIARSGTCLHAAMADEERRIFGLQFHIEVSHTEYGMEILRNFIELCHPAPWSLESYAARVAEQMKKEALGKKVFMLVSGGVDSTVAFTLFNRVLGTDRVQGLLVDTGLMRKGEIPMIREAFGRLGITNLRMEDASEEFFSALEGIVDPEEKRRRIGDTFLNVHRRVSEEMGLTAGNGWVLGQGTIYPDTIETGGTRHADRIKTHHNRVPAIRKMIEEGGVIEPLKELYKDEVRLLGEELGLPHELVWRHPFPGPGLGVRILCVANEVLHSSREPGAGNLQLDVPHAVLPVRSVGVQGDGRTYRQAVALFSHHSCRVTPTHRHLATVIPNTSPTFNRVLLCTSHATPPAFVLQLGFVTRERADLLREADGIVDEEVRQAGVEERIWQFPVVLLPVGMGAGESIVLRPVQSSDAMTADAWIPDEPLLQRITDRLMRIAGIEVVFLDLTSKPPGTIEWE